jgi:hypothetical protein
MNELTLAEARKLLFIDKLRLDEVCQTQADIFYRVAEQYAKSVSVRDKAKEDLTAVDADIALELRGSAEKNGEKMTEGKLLQLVQSSEKHIRAFNDYLDIKYETEQWGALKEAFLQRASMTKELCGLFISGYFSDITVKSDKRMDDVLYEKNRETLKRQRLTRSE